MEIIKNLIDFIFHLDKHLNFAIQNFGTWTYLLLFGIIFAETGLVITPFLPGDSLLFATGAIAATGAMDVKLLFALLAAAAIIGDSVNYAIGKFFGSHIIERYAGRLIKKEHLDRTHNFYEKYGAKTIVLARFVPIVRTFAPFVAGIGKMSYMRFLIYNIFGGILWVAIFVFGGFYFGNMPIIKSNFTLAIFAIVVISILPVAIEVWAHKRTGKK